MELMDTAPAAASRAMPVEPPAAPGAPEHPGQYVIRNAYLRVRVDDLAAYESSITTYTRQLGGYVASQSAMNAGSRLQADYVLRIPAPQLDAFLAGLAGKAAFVESRNVSSEDVTAQYVDVEARIKTRREVEQQYLALLKQARSVEDMVAIQEKLGRIREEIESAEAVRKSLAGQIEYATVTLSVYQELERGFFGGGGWWTAVERAFLEGISGLFGFVLFVVRLWPFLLLALVIGLAWGARRRRP